MAIILISVVNLESFIKKGERLLAMQQQEAIKTSIENL